MDLSVLIPCHNLEKHMDNLLDSIVNQITSYEVEYVFICDNCTDKTEEVICKALDGNNINYSVWLGDAGACGLSRNAAFEVSVGDYIWFVDGDDWFRRRDSIEQALNFIKKQDGNIIKFKFASETYHDSYFSMVWQYCFKREFIEDIRFGEEKIGEDVTYMLKVFEKISPYRIPKLNLELYYYNFGRPGSNTSLFAADMEAESDGNKN